jgi:hypothetical protein
MIGIPRIFDERVQGIEWQDAQRNETAAATLKGLEVMRVIRRGYCILRHAGVTGEICLVNQLFGLIA